MKKLLSAILCLLTFMGISAKEWNFASWPDIDPEHTALLSTGAVSPDGVVQITFEQGTGISGPTMSETGVTMTLQEGNIMRIKIIKPGYTLRRVLAGPYYGSTLSGAVASVGEFVNEPKMNWRDSTSPRAYWSSKGLGDITELTITPNKFRNGTANYFPPFIIEYDAVGTATSPWTRLIPGEVTYKYTNQPCNTLFDFMTIEPNTQIRYEVYKYTEGMEEPDVTVNSKLFNPTDSLIFNDLPFEDELDANTFIRLAARSYVDGMEPSSVARSCQINLSHIVNSAADFPEVKASGYYDTKLVYKGKATVFAICPGFNGKNRYPTLDRYYMTDASGAVFYATGENQEDKWSGVKVGDVITGITGEYDPIDLSTPSWVLPPHFTLARYSYGEVAHVKVLADETPIEVPVQECTVSNFSEMENFKPIVMRGVKPSSQTSNYIRFGSTSTGIKGYFIGYSISVTPTEMKIPSGQAVDIYGVKTGERRFEIIGWEKVKSPAEEPYFFPADSFFAEEFEVPANQTVSLKCYDEPENEIRYTLDGTDPTEESTLYTGPFMLPAGQESVTVKARSFEPEHLPSEVAVCKFIYQDLQNAYFPFLNPEALGYEAAADNGSVVVPDGTTFNVTAGNAKVKLTVTAPDESHPVKFTKFDGHNVLYMPTGTRMDFESNCDIRTIRFEEIEGYSISQKLEVQNRDYTFNEKYNSTDCTISKYDDEYIITNVSLKTVKNRNFNFESIHVVVDDNLEVAIDVNSIAEAQVTENGTLMEFATHVTVNHIYNDEVYVSDATGAFLVKLSDTAKLAPGKRIINLCGRMMLDDETGIRYFNAEMDEVLTSAGASATYPEATIAQLMANYWKPVTLRNVKVNADELGVLTVSNDDEDVATIDYHFGDLQMPIDRYCDIIGIPRAGKEGMTFAPISFVKLHVAPEAVTVDKTEAAMIKGETLTLNATVMPEDADDKTVSWSSSDEAVAIVNAEGVVTALKTGTATISASSNENAELKAECVITISTPAVSITVDKTEAAMIKGETLTLNATVMPEDADDKTVTWSSSDEAVAIVNAEGVVTALKTGTATISASSNENAELKAECVITISTPAVSITLDKTEAAMIKGETLTLNATVMPEDADDKTVSWSSSDEAVAIVNAEGVVTALKSGEATIIVTSNANTELKAECTLTIANPAASISLDKEEAMLTVGQTLTLTATILPEDADDKTVIWISSDEEVATVSEGTVTALKAGKTIITATNTTGDTAVCEVTVENVLPSSITLSALNVEINEGETMRLTAEVLPADAFDKSLVWTSEDENIAMVDDTGLVTAVNAGTTTIVATAAANEEVSAVCTVTVKYVSGISSITADGIVRVAGRKLIIDGYDGVLFNLFSTNGMVMGTYRGNGTTLTATLDVVDGIYFLVSDNGLVRMKLNIR